MKNIRFFKIGSLFFLVVINVFIYSALLQASSVYLTVSFLDVGQGDAIFVESPTGQQMLVDGGPGLSVLRELGKVMPFYDRSIDVLVATHPDQDHVGGLVEVLRRFDVGIFVHTNTTSTSAVYKELQDLIKEKNIKEEIITAPEVVSLGINTEFNILFPDKDTAGWETNDSSIVGKLNYGQNSVLLTGDSPQKIEKYLVGKYGATLRSDVLKAGHHGSKNSNAEVFVGTVAPTYTVISAGLDNRYGHPAKEVVEILNQFGSQILETMGQGMVVFKNDGQNLTLVQRKLK